MGCTSLKSERLKALQCLFKLIIQTESDTSPTMAEVKAIQVHFLHGILKVRHLLMKDGNGTPVVVLVFKR